MQAKATPQSGALKMTAVPPAYIDTVLKRMQSNAHSPDGNQERKKKMAEQEKALLRLKRVIESRHGSEPFAGEELDFNASFDDDEMLLLLMHGVDSDRDGAISEDELLHSSQLTGEIKLALRAAFACNLEAVEQALAKVSDKDFGEYKREKKEASGVVLDRKASVEALFAALDPSASGWVGKADLDSFITKDATDARKEKLASALVELAESLLPAGSQLDFLTMKREGCRE